MVGIYKITNPNGRIYIGQSTDVKGRWNKYSKLHCKDQPSLYSSLKKYGWEKHTKEIIEECKANDLDTQEIYWGEHYNVLSNKNLNCRLGRGFGSYDSEETKIKKRLCHLGRENYWLKGKPLTQEHKDKITKSKTGKKHNITKTRSDKGISKRHHVESIVKAKNKAVLQYDKSNNLIKEWESGKQASRELNISQPNINANCNNKTLKSAGGFIWKFKKQ